MKIPTCLILLCLLNMSLCDRFKNQVFVKSESEGILIDLKGEECVQMEKRGNKIAVLTTVTQLDLEKGKEYMFGCTEDLDFVLTKGKNNVANCKDKIVGEEILLVCKNDKVKLTTDNENIPHILVPEKVGRKLLK